MNRITPEFRKILNDRLGMFVHFGLYSAFEGYYNGQRVPGLGEWIQRKAQIPIKEYESFGRKHFCPDKDFAKNLVSKAKDAGMKFIVLTSKHHDGFCLFKSDYTTYSAYDFYGRDLCKELSDECAKQGLEFGLYYSHTLDWHEKNAAGNFYTHNSKHAGNRNFWDFPDDNIDFEEYLYGKCFPQVREILTNYGQLKIIWFDFPHDITKEQSQELRNLVKSIQPQCQINSRIAHDCNDYESLPDNSLPVAPLGFNVECLVTMNDTWGYCRDDHNWKTPNECIEILCRTLTSNSSLLLNVGPKADGSLTPETENILKKTGQWVRRNSEAVYGNITGNPLQMGFPWGYISKKDSNLYLYVTKPCETIELCGIPDNISKVSLLGADEEIPFEYNKNKLIFNLQGCDTDIPVYKVEFSSPPQFNNEIYQCGNEISLGVLWANKITKDNILERIYIERSNYSADYGTHGLSVSRKTLVCFWASKDEKMCWDVNFEIPGIYEGTLVHGIDMECDEAECTQAHMFLSVDDTKNPVDMLNIKEKFSVSKTSEGNERFCKDCGTFEILKPGKYKVCLSREKDGENVSISEIIFKKIR